MSPYILFPLCIKAFTVCLFLIITLIHLCWRICKKKLDTYVFLPKLVFSLYFSSFVIQTVLSPIDHLRDSTSDVTTPHDATLRQFLFPARNIKITGIRLKGLFFLEKETGTTLTSWHANCSTGEVGFCILFLKAFLI